MQQQILMPVTSELSKKDVVTIPYVLKNKILMAPGTWNDTKYTAEEIRKAFEKTNWSDKNTCSLILDHADKPLSVRDWVGYVRNPRLIGNTLVGDLELWDEDIIAKLVKAKAKFGISPKLRGQAFGSELKDFIFENFSIVVTPAVKPAYINLSQLNKLKGGIMEKELQEEAKEEESQEEESQATEEESSSAAEETEEKVEEELAKKKAKKKKYPYPYEEEEMSEEELLSIVTNSAWTDFVAKMKKKYPKMSFKDIAKAFKKEKSMTEELEKLNDDEIVAKIEQLTSILKRRKKYPYPYEEKKENKEFEELKKKVEELSEKLNEPASKTIQELSESNSEFVGFPAKTSPGVLEMANILQQFAK